LPDSTTGEEGRPLSPQTVELIPQTERDRMRAEAEVALHRYKGIPGHVARDVLTLLDAIESQHKKEKKST